jgi:glutathione S-transferase
MLPVMTVTLHGYHYSVYVRIARVVLAEKSVVHQHVDVDITRPRADAYLRLHPFGRVPTLVHDDLVVYETQAITRYVDEAFPGPALQPALPRQRARMSQIMSIVDSYVYWPMVRQFYGHRVFRPAYGVSFDEEEIRKGLEDSARGLMALESLIAPEGPVAGADTWSLADFHLAPMVAFFVSAPESAALQARHAKLSAWWDTIKRRPSVRDSDAGLPPPRRSSG